MLPPAYDMNPVLGHGALPRPRSGSDAGVDRQRERQLVGSLTNSYKFKESGLVKKVRSTSDIADADHVGNCQWLCPAYDILLFGGRRLSGQVA